MRGADLAFTILDLALVVVCAGVAYRYLTSSGARLYANILKDLLGPSAEQLVTSSFTSDLRVRGPLQLTNIQLPRMQLPMSREEFIVAFERVAPGLYGEALAILGRHASADEWKQFIGRLGDAKNSFEAGEIQEINKRYGGRDLPQIRYAIWQLFPNFNNLISRYEEFLAKVRHANRRRNFRQLTVAAGLLTLCGNLTLNRLLNVGTLQPGSVLFDTHVLNMLPGMLWHREFTAVLGYIAGCIFPTLTIAGVADVLDRKLFGTAQMDFVEPTHSRVARASRLEGDRNEETT